MTPKTVSLKTAQELKAAGFPQNTTHYSFRPDGEAFILQDPSKRREHYIAAPSSDEILEELPEEIKDNDDWLTIQKANGLYCVMYTQYGQPKPYFENASLVEALSAMWLYLKQQGLLEAKT